jgi:hypothetical protein
MAERNAMSSRRTTKAYMREVLQTYRILFGQDERSRRLYAGERPSGTVDPILDDLCERKRIRLDLTYHGISHEQGDYSLAYDFLLLGDRLLELQTYSDCLNPDRLSQLWTDRRNPLQFFTFWAVIIVGGISIVLSLLQLVVSTAQLVIAVRSVPSSCECMG